MSALVCSECGLSLGEWPYDTLAMCLTALKKELATYDAMATADIASLRAALLAARHETWLAWRREYVAHCRDVLNRAWTDATGVTGADDPRLEQAECELADAERDLRADEARPW